jgi:hypothetical protein
LPTESSSLVLLAFEALRVDSLSADPLSVDALDELEESAVSSAYANPAPAVAAAVIPSPTTPAVSQA